MEYQTSKQIIMYKDIMAAYNGEKIGNNINAHQ